MAIVKALSQFPPASVIAKLSGPFRSLVPPSLARIAVACLIATPALLLVLPALAQMQLPGAVAPTEQGATVRPAGPPKPRHKGPPPPPKVPSDDGLLNRTLEQNGRAGAIQFAKDGKDIRLSKVTLAGEKISRPVETCTVEEPGMPLALTSAAKPNGVTRYAAALEGCPIEFDVLEGSILVSPVAKACEFRAADCRVDPAGLWGQPASEIGPARTKEIERARGPAEQIMRNHFRAWIEAAGKDRAMVRRISRFQAGFSSNRAEICNRYARESEHGYCSLIITQAHSTALAVRIALPDPPPEPETARGRKGR